MDHVHNNQTILWPTQKGQSLHRPTEWSLAVACLGRAPTRRGSRRGHSVRSVSGPHWALHFCATAKRFSLWSVCTSVHPRKKSEVSGQNPTSETRDGLGC